jgi:hypothetical protein
VSLAARLRRLEVRWPASTPAPAPLTDEERAQRIAALLARVIDPDTGEPDPTRPDYPRYRRLEELFAAAEARRDAAQGKGAGR